MAASASIRSRTRALLQVERTVVSRSGRARVKLAAGMRTDERRIPQDGRIDMEYAGRRFSARVSALPSLNGEKVVIRLLDPASVHMDIATLGMPEDVLRPWLTAIRTLARHDACPKSARGADLGPPPCTFPPTLRAKG